MKKWCSESGAAVCRAFDPVDIPFIKYNLEYDRSDISKPLLEDKDSLDRFLLVKNEPMLMVYTSPQRNVDENKVRAVICGHIDTVNNTDLGNSDDGTLGVWVRSTAPAADLCCFLFCPMMTRAAIQCAELTLTVSLSIFDREIQSTVKAGTTKAPRPAP